MRLTNLVFATLALAVAAPAFSQNGVLVYTPAPAQTPYSPGIPLGATIPHVVKSVPANGDTAAPASLTKVTIDFDQPMDVATFFYPAPQGTADFPFLTGDPFWTNGNKTFNLPCTLQPFVEYHIPVNTTNQIFRSLQGVAVQPGMITFRTGSPNQAGSVAPSMFNIKTPGPSSFSSGGGFGASTAATPFPNGRTNTNPFTQGSMGAGNPPPAGANPGGTNTNGTPVPGSVTPTPAARGNSPFSGPSSYGVNNPRNPNFRRTPTPTPSPTPSH